MEKAPHIGEVRIVVIDQQKQKHEIFAQAGVRLREVLIKNNLTPHTKITHNLNCGGNGLCATCGIWILEGEKAPIHWHDRLAKRFGYPRLSCQVTTDQNLVIVLPEKWIWGSREASRLRKESRSGQKG